METVFDGSAASVAASLAIPEYALIMVLLVVGAAVDARHRVIPDAVPAGIVALHVLAIAAAWAFDGASLAPMAAAALAGGVAVGGGLLAFTMAYERFGEPGSFGGGDIKLMAALGFALGCGRALAVLLVACVVFCLQIAVVSLRAPTRDGPFAPAIALAALVVLAA